MNLKNQLSVIALIFFIAFIGCKKEKQAEILLDINRAMYVLSKKGIILRSQPSVASEQLAVIPYRSKLISKQKTSCEDVIYGIHDYWYNAEWSGKRGWVFGGFVDEYDPDIYVITRSSVGPAKLNMNFNEFISYFKYDKIESDDHGINCMYRDNQHILTFHDKNGGRTKKVRYVYLNYPKFKTASGIHVGMSIRELQKIYSRMEVKFDEHDYFAPSDLQTKHIDSEKEIVFTLDFQFDDQIPKLIKGSIIDQSLDVKGNISGISIYYFN